MAALVCDICGGKLKVVNNSIAVCESCGMEHTLERVRQKYHEGQEIIHVDNAHLIDNYYSMAKDSFEATNLKETENYCNKIIEIDFENSNALFLKGKAVGRQSTFDQLRFMEASICFANAVNSCTNKAEKKTLHNDVADEFKTLATALIRLQSNRFQKTPNELEAKRFIKNLDELNDSILHYTKKTKQEINRNYVFSNVSALVEMCISFVSLTILLEYKLSGTRTAYSDFVAKTDNCITITQKTIQLCDDDGDSDYQLYNLCVVMTESLINNNTSDQIIDNWGAYHDTLRLSSNEVLRRQNIIQEYKNKMKQLERD